jgi:tetratricopeptide (TPR) repeat protein
VLAFVAGERDPQVEDHVDECEACRQLLAAMMKKRATGTEDTYAITPANPATDETALAKGTPGPPPTDGNEWAPGTRIGRYVVLSRIGRGGMGTVFRAEDVELGRPVALKRLHAEANAESRARLVREARSAAQLQHPNVVTVHEVSEHLGAPFLAMELVDGVTLTAWLKETSRSWREVVDVVAQAGRGLVAAHARGLVHRDFKPDNVLVDRTGRARVADFGLARALDATASEPSGPISHDTRLTITGSLAGTPAYMAPELVEGGAPDARSDQYAFAITLYEALRGQHPFEGDTAARLWVEMASGKIRSGGHSVPAWLDRHVRRGLEVEPAKRWPDLASFVDAISKPPRRALLIAVPIALASIATVAVVAWPRSHGVDCDDVAAEYIQSFDPQDLARAIPDKVQLGLANKAIDEFTTDYRKALRESCRATQAGTQSAEIGDKRTACLERAKRRAWFVTSGITTGIDSRPGLAVLLDELPDPGACNDPEWLQRASPLPVGEADREALMLAESNLLHASKVRDDGDLEHASNLIISASATAKRLNDRALDARANLLAVEIALDRGDTSTAERRATEAWSAASVSGDTDLTLRAQLAMLHAAASHDRRAIESFAGLGNVPESANGARLLISDGDALMASGQFKEGEEAYRRAVAIREKVLPAGHVDISLAWQRVGAALVVQKRAKEALPVLEKANAVVEKSFPPLRREAIDGVRYFAMAAEELGDHEKALGLYREVLRRRTQVHGAKHGLTLEARKDIAGELCALDKDDECIAEYEATVAGLYELYGDRTGNIADARVHLANTLISNGRIAEADQHLAKALPLLEKIHGVDSPYYMVGEYAQVRSWTERAKPIRLDDAVKSLDRLEPVFTKLFGASSSPVGAVLYSRARVAFANKDPKTADELMQRALPMFGDAKSDHQEALAFHAHVLAALGKGPKPTTPLVPIAHAAPAAPVTPKSGPCAKAGNHILDLWPGDERDLILGWYRTDPDEGEKLVAIVDKWVNGWRASYTAACIAGEQGTAKGVVEQRMLCLDRARSRAAAHIKNRANGTKSALVGSASLPSFASCATAKDTVPDNDDKYVAIEEGERALEEARIMQGIPYRQAVHRSLSRVKDKLRIYNDASLAERLAQFEQEVAAAEAAKP